jgi:hypothetical protein
MEPYSFTLISGSDCLVECANGGSDCSMECASGGNDYLMECVNGESDCSMECVSGGSDCSMECASGVRYLMHDGTPWAVLVKCGKKQGPNCKRTKENSKH